MSPPVMALIIAIPTERTISPPQLPAAEAATVPAAVPVAVLEAVAEEEAGAAIDEAIRKVRQSER